MSSIVSNNCITLISFSPYFMVAQFCELLGGYIYIPGTAGASNLVTLLNNNAVAQKEVSAFSQFWVYNGNHPLTLFPTFHVYLVLVFLSTRSQYSLLWLCSLDFFPCFPITFRCSRRTLELLGSEQKHRQDRLDSLLHPTSHRLLQLCPPSRPPLPGHIPSSQSHHSHRHHPRLA